VLIDVQFNPAHNGWPVLRDATQAAETAGFGVAWVYDHLAGRSLGGEQMLEAFTLLGALAATTRSIGLGTMVANVASRQPGLLAVAMASVAAIAQRRVFLGIGAGTSPDGRWATEMHAVGQPIEPTLPRRHAVVERVLDLVDAMWSADRDPKWDTFPFPHPRPPVIVGVGSVTLAQVAGRRADGVNVAWHHPRRDDVLAAARGAFADSGRAGDFTLTTWTRWDDTLLDEDHPQRRAMGDRGIDRLVLAELGAVRPDHIATLRPADR
jgi:alkanesulfonate monooxygenase SsuD/methylene tetrahydromethanopterin reductase-like flavin-dependent oxidoreductase (luciferase family)